MNFKVKLYKAFPVSITFFSFLYPRFMDYLQNWHPLIVLIYLCQLFFAFTVIGGFCLKLIKGMKMSKQLIGYLILILIFNICFLISDLYAGVISQTYTINLRRILVMVAILLYIDLSPNKQIVYICKWLYYYMSLIAFLSVIFYICFPTGIAKISMMTDSGYVAWSDKINFLDADNRISLFILLYYFIANLYLEFCEISCKKKKYVKVFSYLLILGNVCLARSGSGIMGLIALIACHFIIKYIKGQQKVSWKFFAVFLFIIGMFVSGNMNWLIDVLGIIFNKGITLSGRTVIWSMAIDKIKDSPIMGLGTLEGGAFFKVGEYTWYAHDQYLDFWLQGGIFALISFVAFIVLCQRNARLNMKKDIYNIFVSTLVAYLVVGIVEHFFVRNYYQFYCFLCIAYGVCKITSLEEDLE